MFYPNPRACAPEGPWLLQPCNGKSSSRNGMRNRLLFSNELNEQFNKSIKAFNLFDITNKVGHLQQQKILLHKACIFALPNSIVDWRK